jgi:hypothetical protein
MPQLAGVGMGARRHKLYNVETFLTSCVPGYSFLIEFCPGTRFCSFIGFFLDWLIGLFIIGSTIPAVCRTVISVAQLWHQLPHCLYYIYAPHFITRKWPVTFSQQTDWLLSTTVGRYYYSSTQHRRIRGLGESRRPNRLRNAVLHSGYIVSCNSLVVVRLIPAAALTAWLASWLNVATCWCLLPICVLLNSHYRGLDCFPSCFEVAPDW